jgi:predicted nucleotidyltransferase
VPSLSTIPAFLERIAARLGRIDGVVAVALGGSWARGAARPDSDFDLGLYYRPERQPPVEALCRLAQELDDRHPPNAVTAFGEWGPWINGGAWLEIEGHRVDWLYRDLDRVARTIAACRAGQPTCDYQIGHPHGFHSHMYMGEVYHARVLHDPDGALAALQALTAEYPPPLRRRLIDRFLFEAQFTVDISRKPARRGDVFYVSGCLFRCIACLVQVLFALNRRYFLNEKGAVASIETFPLRPADFGETAARVFEHGGAGVASIDQCAELVVAVRQLCVEHGAVDV